MVYRTPTPLGSSALYEVIVINGNSLEPPLQGGGRWFESNTAHQPLSSCYQ